MKILFQIAIFISLLFVQSIFEVVCCSILSLIINPTRPVGFMDFMDNLLWYPAVRILFTALPYFFVGMLLFNLMWGKTKCILIKLGICYLVLNAIIVPIMGFYFEPSFSLGMLLFSLMLVKAKDVFIKLGILHLVLNAAIVGQFVFLESLAGPVTIFCVTVLLSAFLVSGLLVWWRPKIIKRMMPKSSMQV